MHARGYKVAAEVLLGVPAVALLSSGGDGVTPAVIIGLLGVAAWTNPAPFGWLIVALTAFLLAVLFIGLGIVGAESGDAILALAIVGVPGLACGILFIRAGRSERGAARDRPRPAQ